MGIPKESKSLPLSDIRGFSDPVVGFLRGTESIEREAMSKIPGIQKRQRGLLT